MAFHGTPKIHADLPPGVRQGGVEGVGFSASGEAGGLHVFRGCLEARSEKRYGAKEGGHWRLDQKNVTAQRNMSHGLWVTKHVR